jgi:FlaA1/EpsC-like NDP-sugar epimerase
MNVIDAAIDRGVKGVVALSTDKASNPINLYGATKLASDKLFVSANSLSGGKGPKLSVVRYGNVMGSRGSVIPFFQSIASQGSIPITNDQMTRFMITLNQGVELVWHAFNDMVGGEIYVKKIPSMKITDIAESVAPGVQQEIVGIRPGEKIHEQMIGIEDAPYTYEFADYYKILPAINNWHEDSERKTTGKLVEPSFIYSSDNNKEWMTKEDLTIWIEENKNDLGKI